MQLLKATDFSAHSDYQLQFMQQNITDNIKHQPFQMQYKSLDIFGYHMLLHHDPNSKTMITGYVIKQIDKDLPTLATTFTDKDLLNKAIKAENISTQQIKFPSTQKIIYIHPKTSKAHLAYLVSFFAPHFSQPMKIYDAQTGELLDAWSNSKSIKSGLGPGGNSAVGIGILNYVAAPNVAQELPAFDVSISGATYTMNTAELQLRDYNAADSSVFPISIASEGVGTNPAIYSFNGPTNNAVGQQVVSGANTTYPANDAMFHAGLTIDALKNTYGVSNPIGTDLPLQIYVRIQDLNNAFSIDTIKSNGTVTLHQQLVIGNGDTVFYPLAMGTMAHELCHNVTNNFSKMVCTQQSGGMNEAFSDMCELALYSHIRGQGYTWYWGGATYDIGRNEDRSGNPLRYLNNPSLDGNSINNADNFTSGINVHYSSGVFNRAYYLIAVTYGFGPDMTFRYMMNANMNYWVANNTFVYGACGTIQAAFDRNKNYKNVIEAFNDVGITCKLFTPLKQVVTNSYSY